MAGAIGMDMLEECIVALFGSDTVVNSTVFFVIWKPLG